MSELQAKYEVATKPEFPLGLMQEGISLFLDVQRFEFAQRVAKMLATSSMLPAQFQNNLGNCMIALDMANRMRVNPFMLMQTMYIVHGRPGIEAKLAIALFNDGTHRFQAPLKFEKEGDYPKGKDARCRAFAKEIQTGEILQGEWIDWDMIKGEGWLDKAGSKWKTMPGQMFVYRAAMFFIREYEPGVLLGLRTKDELDDMVIDVTPSRSLTPVGATEASGEPIYDIKDSPTAGGEVPAPPKQEPPAPPQTEVPKERTLFDQLMTARGQFKALVTGYFKEIEKLPPDQYEQVKTRWAKAASTGSGGVTKGAPWPLVEKQADGAAASSPADTGEGSQSGENVDPGQDLEEDPFITEVNRYKEQVDPHWWELTLKLYGMVGKPIEEMPEESREMFLSRCRAKVGA